MPRPRKDGGSNLYEEPTEKEKAEMRARMAERESKTNRRNGTAKQYKGKTTSEQFSQLMKDQLSLFLHEAKGGLSATSSGEKGYNSRNAQLNSWRLHLDVIDRIRKARDLAAQEENDGTIETEMSSENIALYAKAMDAFKKVKKADAKQH